jgi:hypothetical protein
MKDQADQYHLAIEKIEGQADEKADQVPVADLIGKTVVNKE